MTTNMQREKARNLRYKKAVASGMNISDMMSKLEEIIEACDEVTYYVRNDSGDETLLQALDNDQDEVWEFKMAFSDLSAESSQMYADLCAMFDMDQFNATEYEGEYYDVPENANLFDSLMAGCGTESGMLGYDEEEHDYFGLSSFEGRLGMEEANKRLMRLTKEKMLEMFHKCSRLMLNFVGIEYRFDCLEASLKILREQNDGVLRAVREIEAMYDKAQQEDGIYWWNDKELQNRWERVLNELPAEVWIG